MNVDIYREFEMESKEYDRITKDQAKLRETIQNYEHKKSETLMVKNELELVNEEEVVYKLIGPTLIQQDTGDCKIQIDSRLDMINKEIAKFERTYKDNEIKLENKRKKIQELNNRFVQLAKQQKIAQGQK